MVALTAVLCLNLPINTNTRNNSHDRFRLENSPEGRLVSYGADRQVSLVA